MAQKGGRDQLPTDRAFVVQFNAAARLGDGPVSGRVEHVLSHRSVHFESREQLLAFMQRQIETATERKQENSDDER